MNWQVVCLVAQFGADALHVVVVNEVIELYVGWDHALRATHGMGNLKVVVIVMSAVESLVQRVVSHAVERALVCPAGVITMYDLAHEPEIGLGGVCRLAKRLHKLKVKDVGSV